MNHDFVLTSESVTDAHPDKLCDQISDAIVGGYLSQDPAARVVAECAVSTGIVFVAVKTSSGASIDVPQTAREVIREVGYDRGEFSARTCTVMTNLGAPATPVAAPIHEERLGDDEVDRVVCLDNANLFGFACDQTVEMLPLPISRAHALARRVAAATRDGVVEGLMPDAKVQVGVEFRDRRPRRIYCVTVVATQVELERPAAGRLREALLEAVVRPFFADEEIRPDGLTRIEVNPEGPVRGGPVAHAGLTGRKNGVDTYGEYSRHSGAALSGKDPSRIDRVGAYAARHAAKNVVAAGLASECEVFLSYSVGRAKPVTLQVETYGTGRVEDEEIRRRLKEHVDFRPAAIVRRFGLRSLAATPGGFYRQLAAYGHMGRVDLDAPWERLDLAPVLEGA